mgnify:CR=1 FL=1
MKKNWALILGGSSGLGLATAKKLAKHGFHMIVIHRDRRADLEAINTEFNEITSYGVLFKAFNVDALQKSKRDAVINEVRDTLPTGHKIRVLVHSIAKGNLKPMYAEGEATLTDQDLKITLDAMALSLYDWTTALINADLFAGDTRIISFTSEGNTRSLPNYAAVSLAKVALESLTRSMALEFAPLGIKANCIQAGITLTKSFEKIPGYGKNKAAALKRNPNKRLTTPEDIANAVYLLTMDEAQWITGTVIKVDGGESLR